MEDEQQRRLGLNEALARQVNTLVDDVAAHWFERGERLEFQCECVHESCRELVRLTRDEFLGVRSDPRQFVVRAGHEMLEIEDVVGQLREYLLIRKKGVGAAVAMETDRARAP